jgi:hypothetical protein
VAAGVIVAAPVLGWRLLSATHEHDSTAHVTTFNLDGVTLTVSAPPSAQKHLTPQEAVDIVQEQLSQGLPAFEQHCPPSHGIVGCADKPFTHIRAVSATFVGNVDRIRDACGGVYQFTPPASAWLVRLDVPPQDGFTSIEGGYVVNDVTATIIGSFFAAGQGKGTVC